MMYMRYTSLIDKSIHCILQIRLGQDLTGLCRFQMLDLAILLPAQVFSRTLHLQIIFAGIGDLVHSVPGSLKQLVKGLERPAGCILLKLLALTGAKCRMMYLTGIATQT